MEARAIKGNSLSYVLAMPDGAKPDGSWPLVVMLHGLSTSMYDICDLAPAIDAEGYVYAFPNGPFRMPLRDGYVGQSWIADRAGVEAPPPDHPPVDSLLEGFISELLDASGTRPGNLVIGGFSQGGGIALRFGLPRPEMFAGVFSLSGALHDAEALRGELPGERTTPIYMSHGVFDTRRFERIDQTRQFLEGEGYKVDFGQYNAGHEISEAVVGHLGKWLHLQLPPRSA